MAKCQACEAAASRSHGTFLDVVLCIQLQSPLRQCRCGSGGWAAALTAMMATIAGDSAPVNALAFGPLDSLVAAIGPRVVHHSRVVAAELLAKQPNHPSPIPCSQ